MCSECGENPVVPGSEYCAQCLKEMNRASSSSDDEPMSVGEATIGIDTVSTMDEIVIDDVSAEGAPFGDDEDFMDDDEDEEEPDEAVGGKQRRKRRSQDAELKASGFSVVDGDEASNDLLDR